MIKTGFQAIANRNRKDVLHVEIRFNNASLEIRPVWHIEKMLPYAVKHHIEALADTIKVCLSSSDTTIQDCLKPTESDLNDIWGWNHKLPPTHSFCMQDRIARELANTQTKSRLIPGTAA